MVTVSYNATQQMKRLSSLERRDLQRILESGDLQNETVESDAPGRFVSRLGKDKRVVWSRDHSGNIVVRTVVAR